MIMTRQTLVLLSAQRHNVAKDYPEKVTALQKPLAEIRHSERSAL
jgi:hypothetical protein